MPAFEIAVGQEDGKAVLSLKVPEGKGTPYYHHADGRMEAFVRVGNQSVAADATKIRDLALKGSNQTWDALDSGIPARKASFTVLRAALATSRYCATPACSARAGTA